jgi:16S rRNA (guanine966-N2)-methyltransferase
MRVIAGEYRGRILVTVKDLSVRPATDRVRQTLFDMLTTRMVFDGATVLDLFAGSGSLGIEALSRGAGRVVFVESSAEAASCIERNLASLGCRNRGEVVVRDAGTFLASPQQQYDLVFADPPYGYGRIGRLPEMIFGRGLVAAGGYLLIEHTRDAVFSISEQYAATITKKFGRTLVTFFRPAAQQ